MAARAIWKGYLRLTLVTCAVALYPAATDSNRIRFHKINRATGNRLRMRMVDEETGDEVDREDQARGFALGKEDMVTVTDEELDALAVEGTHMMDIAKFVPRDEIDPLYFDAPYFLAPQDKPSEEAFTIIRDAMKRQKIAALSKLVLHNRERVVLLEPRDRGLMATLLRWPYELRKQTEVFGDIPAESPADAELLDVAESIVKRKMGHWDPSEFKDSYEDALAALLEEKRTGHKPKAQKAPASTKPSGILAALRESLAQLEVKEPQPERAPAERSAPKTAQKKKTPATRRKPAKASS